MNKWLELSPIQALKSHRLRTDATIVPYRRARLRIRGSIDGGGRLDVGVRWRDGYFAPTDLIVQENARCKVTGTFRLYAGTSVVVAPGAFLRLGSGFMNNGASIMCFSEIALGDDVVVGPEVMIRDSDSHAITGSRGGPTLPITIGSHAWIGARAIILKGVTIHDGAVIAAGAVVTEDVEPGTLVAGVPARLVRDAEWVHDAPAQPAGGARTIRGTRK